MFSKHVIEPTKLASRFVELLPEYLPGVDTGAFEATDRRRCWNKTLKTAFTVMGKEDKGLDVVFDRPTTALHQDQSSLLWQRAGTALFAMTTGWGDRSQLDASFEGLESFKCPQKLLVYSCSKWQEAVTEQINGAFLRYAYHVDGEQYLFMNLVGASNCFHLFYADVHGNGLQSSTKEGLVRPVAGSPFTWRV